VFLVLPFFFLSCVLGSGLGLLAGVVGVVLNRAQGRERLLCVLGFVADAAVLAFLIVTAYNQPLGWWQFTDERFK
jgi:hypothetical protein